MIAPGVIGARQAGAGFGGCMVAFVETGKTDAFAAAVSKAYGEMTGLTPEIYPVEASEGAGLMEAVSFRTEAPATAKRRSLIFPKPRERARIR